MKHRSGHFPSVAVFMAAMGLVRPAWAIPDLIKNAAPADVVAVYFVDLPKAAPGEESGNSFEVTTTLIDQAFTLGLLSPFDVSIRGWLDALACVAPVIAHPHTVMLFDLQVQRDQRDRHTLASLAAGLVLETRGENSAMEKRIQHLLASYTNREDSTLDVIEHHQWNIHRLRDRRLPPWLVVCWCPLQDLFVVTIGEDSIRRILDVAGGAAPSVAGDAWFRQAVGDLAAESALVTLYVRFDGLRKNSSALGRKIDQVLEPLGIPGCEQGLWALGYDGRSVEIRQNLRRQNENTAKVIAGSRFLDSTTSLIIPDDATAFSVVGVDPAEWFEKVRRAYLAARSGHNADESRRYWNEVEKTTGICFARFFNRLGGPVIVHDYPQHALRLPPAWTVVVPVKREEELLRRDIDALLSFWRQELEQGGGLRLHRRDDGIWFLRAGLEGPAVVVRDGHLIASFSPRAVIQNLDVLKKSGLRSLGIQERGSVKSGLKKSGPVGWTGP